jgi:uncharacterized membrane protein
VNAFAWIFTLATIGLAETAYLIRARRLAERPVCPIGGDCAAVLGSKYNRLLGFVHNDVLGGLFYLAMAGFTALLVIGVGLAYWWTRLMTVMVAGGSLLSIGLVFIQWRIVKAWCFWCLASAATVFLMAGILAVKLFLANP